jgi:hypothetical protein
LYIQYSNFFLIACFVNSLADVTFRKALILCTRKYTPCTMWSTGDL